MVLCAAWGLALSCGKQEKMHFFVFEHCMFEKHCILWLEVGGERKTNRCTKYVFSDVMESLWRA